MKRFAAGMVMGLALVYGGLAASYAALATLWPNSLPAPAISRLVPLDEKLRFLRENGQLDPRILAVGSSITWRQIAGDVFEEMTEGDGGFLNGATGYLKIHQTIDLLDFYLQHYDGIDTVMIFAGPPDFEDCSAEPAALLDHADAARYAFDGAPSPYFYIRYFSPQRYLRSAMTLARHSRPLIGELHLDRYGSSPLELPASMLAGLRYGETGFDPACAEALLALPEALAARGIRLVVAFAPIHPEYRRLHPRVVERIGRVAAGLKAAADRSGGRVMTFAADESYRADDFFDAFHLQWPAVRHLSAEVAAAMTAARPDGARAPHLSWHRDTGRDTGRGGAGLHGRALEAASRRAAPAGFPPRPSL